MRNSRLSSFAGHCWRTSLLPVLVLAAGCAGGSDVKLVNLSGKVTYAGAPVVYGTIEFIPDTAANHKGPAGNAQIHDGVYDMSENGRGIVAGPHVVRFTAFNEVPQNAPADETIPFAAKPPLFVGYPIKMELKEGVQDFDIPAKAKGFDMFKSNAPMRRGNEP